MYEDVHMKVALDALHHRIQPGMTVSDADNLIRNIITKNDIIAGLRRARTPARQFRWLRSHRRAIGYWLTRRWARGSRSA